VSKLSPLDSITAAALDYSSLAHHCTQTLKGTSSAITLPENLIAPAGDSKSL
jgi:hypothetical protein